MLKDFFDKPFTLDRLSRIFFTFLIVAVLVFIIRGLSSILVPFALAWLTAYMLMPLVYFFQNTCHFKSRILSLMTVLIIVASVLTGLFLLLWPSLSQEVNKAWDLINTYANYDSIKTMLPETVREKLSEYPDIESVFSDMNVESVSKGLQKFFERSAAILAGTFNFLMSATVIFLFFLYLIFIMMDYEILNAGIFYLMPDHLHEFALEAKNNIRYYISNYFKGQSLIALSVGILLATGYSIQGIPMGLTIGLLIGAFNLIPYLQIIGVIPLAFAALLHSANTGDSFLLTFAISFGILMLVQVIQDTILTPNIMGKTMGMRPAVILLSLSIFGFLFGLLGMVFALPATMILYTYHMKYVVGKPLETGALLNDREVFHWRRKLNRKFKKKKD